MQVGQRAPAIIRFRRRFAAGSHMCRCHPWAVTVNVASPVQSLSGKWVALQPLFTVSVDRDKTPLLSNSG
jgi:hypothetical protein